MNANANEGFRPKSAVLVRSSAQRSCIRDTLPPVTLLSTCIALALATAVLPAQQAAAQQQQSQQTGLEEITVTGSRIHQNQDYASPNPISTFDAQKMESLGLVNMSDVITQVPQNVSQFQAATTGGSAFFIGSTLANLRGLNPFFGTRTLTLVNSRRFIPTTQGDSVDLNFIPSILINRTEVVTGGASAAYGSGAISGVVNILLDNKMEGVKLDVDYGATGQGDGSNYHVGVGGGTAFGGERGHFIAGGEYQKSDVIQSCSDARDWCSKGVGMFNNNTAFAFGVGTPYAAKIPGPAREHHRAESAPKPIDSRGRHIQQLAHGNDDVPVQCGRHGHPAVRDRCRRLVRRQWVSCRRRRRVHLQELDVVSRNRA